MIVKIEVELENIEDLEMLLDITKALENLDRVFKIDVKGAIEI